MTKHIIPRYKLMLFYDLKTPETETYYQFVMNELIPSLHEMGLYIFRAFHTIPGVVGESAQRQVEFVAEDLATVNLVLESDEWQNFETKLLTHATNYSKKTVRFRQGFQL